MTRERLYNLCYNILRAFHWITLFIIVEFFFGAAGWMLFGIAGFLLAQVANWISGLDYEQDFLTFFQQAGKVTGGLAGIAYMRFVLGRYIKVGRPE